MRKKNLNMGGDNIGWGADKLGEMGGGRDQPGGGDSPIPPSHETLYKYIIMLYIEV